MSAAILSEEELLSKVNQAIEKVDADNAINKMAINKNIDGATQGLYYSDDGRICISIMYVGDRLILPLEWIRNKSPSMVEVAILQDSSGNRVTGCRMVYLAMVDPLEPFDIELHYYFNGTIRSRTVDISHMQRTFDPEYMTYTNLFRRIQEWLGGPYYEPMYRHTYGVSYARGSEKEWFDICDMIQVDDDGSTADVSWVNEYIRLIYHANLDRSPVVDLNRQMHEAIHYPEVALRLLTNKGITSKRLLGRDDKFVLANYAERIKDMILYDVNRIYPDHVMWAGCRICVKHAYNNLINYALLAGELLQEHAYNDPVIKLKDKNLLQIVDGTQIRNLLSTIHEYNYVEREKRSAILKEERDKIRKGENDFEI